MGLSVREKALSGLKAALDGITAIAGLAVLRNESAAIENFPTLIQFDADSSQRVAQRAADVTIYALTVTLEGYVSAAAAGDVGPALSDLYARAWAAAKGAEGSVAAIDEILEGDLDATIVDEEGTAPHAMFVFDVELRFATTPDNPFTQA